MEKREVVEIFYYFLLRILLDLEICRFSTRKDHKSNHFCNFFQFSKSLSTFQVALSLFSKFSRNFYILRRITTILGLHSLQCCKSWLSICQSTVISLTNFWELLLDWKIGILMLFYLDEKFSAINNELEHQLD